MVVIDLIEKSFDVSFEDVADPISVDVPAQCFVRIVAALARTETARQRMECYFVYPLEHLHQRVLDGTSFPFAPKMVTSMSG
jgi:hypothetical protein